MKTKRGGRLLPWGLQIKKIQNGIGLGLVDALKLYLIVTSLYFRVPSPIFSP